MPVIDNAIYIDGQRAESPKGLDESFRSLRVRDGIAWIGLYRPTDSELRASRKNSNFTASPYVTRPRVTSVPSSNGTGKRCSSCSGQPAISMRSRA